jgi:hypothetical protein
MHPYSNDRAKRNTTFLALLVWLFALASGIANACLLATPGEHSHIAAHQSSGHIHADRALTDQGVPTGQHDDDTDASRDSCLKACNDGSNALVNWQSGSDLTDPGLAPPFVFAWHEARPVVSELSWFDTLEVPTVGPPFRVLYSRLTL